jgi:hypothetical protein
MYSISNNIFSPVVLVVSLGSSFLNFRKQMFIKSEIAKKEEKYRKLFNLGAVCIVANLK